MVFLYYIVYAVLAIMTFLFEGFIMTYLHIDLLGRDCIFFIPFFGIFVIVFLITDKIRSDVENERKQEEFYRNYYSGNFKTLGEQLLCNC